MLVTTPGDYTVMISNLNSAFELYWKKVNKINYMIVKNNIKEKIKQNSSSLKEMISNDKPKISGDLTVNKLGTNIPEIAELGLEDIVKDKVINISEGFNLFLKNKICVAEDQKYNIYQINICYKIHSLKEYEDKIQNLKSQILKINHDPKQINKNKEKNLKDNNRKFFIYPINIYGINFCQSKVCEKSIKLSVIENKKTKLEDNLNKLFSQSKFLTINNFTGVVFVTFNTKKEQELFLKPYPKNFIHFLFKSIINLKYYFCGCFISYERRKRFFLIRNIVADPAPEPEEIQFENLQTTTPERLCRTFSIYFISVIIIGISYIFISRLNAIQRYIEDKEEENNGSNNKVILIRYILSLVITIIISIINVIFQIWLETLTKIEKHITMTNYYLSFSIKLTLFTFITSSIIPLVSNYMNNKDNYDLLVTNMFVMFLSNSFVTPIMWTMDFTFFLKKIIQCFIEKKKIHSCTQNELNQLYELPDMKIAYKYSYLGKTFLMTFLFIPIFPMGILISLMGIILSYFLEKYNFIYMYKRPEMLNSNLCEFYSNYFVLNFFMLGIGDYIFISENRENNIWSVTNLNLFAGLMLIPFNQIFTFDFIKVKESELNDDKNYEEMYFNFYNDYERTNPITKKEGMKRFIYKLKEKGYINTIDEAILKNLNNINLMEIYYKTRQNFARLLIQKGFALYQKRNKNKKYFNILKRFVKGSILKKKLLKPEVIDKESSIGNEDNYNCNEYDFDTIKKSNDLGNYNSKESKINKESSIRNVKSFINSQNNISSNNDFISHSNNNNTNNIESDKITIKSEDNKSSSSNSNSSRSSSSSNTNQTYKTKEDKMNKKVNNITNLDLKKTLKKTRTNKTDDILIKMENNNINKIIENEESEYFRDEYQHKILKKYTLPFHLFGMNELESYFKENVIKDSEKNVTNFIEEESKNIYK